jgi:hypothetical protein
MSTLFVDTINEKTSGNGVQIPGHVVQVQYKNLTNTTFTTNSNSNTAITNWYVDITPKYSDSLLIWSATLTSNVNDADGYGRFSIYDELPATPVKWSSNSYIAGNHYNFGQGSTDRWPQWPIMTINTAGQTTAMRLGLRVAVSAGGTFSMSWSGSDNRTISVMEIAQ